MIKKLLIITVCVMFSASAIAAEQTEDQEKENGKKSALCPFASEQDDYKMDVLIKKSPFEKKKIVVGGFITPVLKYPIVGDYMNVFTGLRGALLINHHFAMGITGNFMPMKTTNRELTGDDIDKENIYWKYGGPYFEYYFFPDKIVHLSLGLTVGAGWLSEEFMSMWEGRKSYFFALEPELNLYLNVSKRHRLGIGASYLFTHGARLYGVRDNDIRNFSVSLFAQLGIF